MVNLKKNWWQILFLTLITTIVIRQGHEMDGTSLPIELLPLSLFSETYGEFGVETFIVAWFITIFSLMCIAFIIAEKAMDGSKSLKGPKFAISWGMIYFLGAIEWYPAFGKTALIDDIRLGGVDLVGIIALGVLSGKFFASDSKAGKTDNKQNGFIVLVVTLFYLVGRYFAYFILGIESGYIERPVATFIWTLVTGISFGVFYIIAGRNIIMENLMKKSAFFGLIIIGPSWLVFNFFYPVIFQASFFDLIFGRAILDIVLVTAGVYVSERILVK